jgi:hypothetical protein
MGSDKSEQVLALLKELSVLKELDSTSNGVPRPTLSKVLVGFVNRR